MSLLVSWFQNSEISMTLNKKPLDQNYIKKSDEPKGKFHMRLQKDNSQCINTDKERINELKIHNYHHLGKSSCKELLNVSDIALTYL